MMFPTGLLILPRLTEYNGNELGLVLLCLAAGFCCVNCWFVLQSKPSTWRHCLVPGSIVPFLPFIYWSMTEAEWLYTWGVILSMMCGTFVYAAKWDVPGINPSFAGHHELLHILSCVASACVYLLSFSACSA